MARVGQGVQALLAEILEAQLGRAEAENIPQERIVEALTRGPGLTNEEKRLLWLSPEARDTYLAIRRRLSRSLEQRLRDRGIEMETTLLAASGGETDNFSCEGEGWTVVAQKDGGEWIVSLHLKETARQAIPPMTTLQLVDKGGVEWLRGRPDESGDINAVWPHARMSPADRVTLGLELKPC